ncbi:MAG: hypothetical protein HYT12_02120 [Candidatus Liptonbacteria bacterium]|nr:hypothetical protein [Candidatus Liptonbacteria bacterium]
MIYVITPQKTMYYDKVNTEPTRELYQYNAGKPPKVKSGLNVSGLSDIYHEYNMDIQTDQFGFRREKTDPLKPTVIILGDSQTFGFGVLNPEAYPNLLDEMDNSCQIVNAGKPGAGLNHYVYYLKEMLASKNFKNIKQIIIGLNMPGNDWNEMVSLSKKIDPELSQFIPDSTEFLGKKKSLSSRAQELLFYSQAYTFMRFVVAPRLKHFVLGFTDLAKAEQEEYEKTGPAVETLIKLMQSATKEKKIDIIFIFFPERPHYFKKPLTYIKNLQSFMNENGIKYLDLIPQFKESYTKIDDFWLPIDGHFNASGHKFMAEAINKANIISCR